MNGWIWKSKQLLLHAPIIWKPNANNKSTLDITRDLYNPLLWSVILQTDNGTRTISVHRTRYSARRSILRMKGIENKTQWKEDS